MNEYASFWRRVGRRSGVRLCWVGWGVFCGWGVGLWMIGGGTYLCTWCVEFPGWMEEKRTDVFVVVVDLVLW